jgi:hypothetical protein
MTTWSHTNSIGTTGPHPKLATNAAATRNAFSFDQSFPETNELCRQSAAERSMDDDDHWQKEDSA